MSYRPDFLTPSPMWRAVIAATFMLGAVLYLLLPPSPDQFDHGYSAWRVLNGAVPYRDVKDVNWPGVIGLHALSQAIFGVHVWSWRAFDFLLMLPAAWCMADLVRGAAGALGARLVLVVFPLLYVSAGYWVAGQKDMTAAQFLVVAVWFHCRAYLHARIALQAACGACIGIAVLNKPTLAVLLPLLPLHALCYGYALRRIGAFTLVATLSCGLTVASAVLGLLALGTELREFTEMVVTYQRHARSLDIDAVSRVVAKLLLFRMSGFWTSMIALCLPIWYWLYRRNEMSMQASALVVLWIAGLVSMIVQGHGYGYHLSPTILAAIGTVSIGMTPALNALVAGDLPVRRRGAALAVLLLLGAGVAYRLHQSYGALPGALRAGNLESYWQGFQGEAGSGLSLADATRFVNRLQREREPGCIFFVGEGSAINLLAQKMQPTRFYYLPTIQRALPPLPMSRSWNELWAADLAHADCPYVLVSYRRNAEWLDGPTAAAVALRGLLAQYERVGAIGGDDAVLVYRSRKN